MLEIATENNTDTIKETQNDSKQFSTVATAGGDAVNVRSISKPNKEKSTLVPVSGGAVSVENQAKPEEDNTNILYYIATINYLIIGAANEQCRLILNEYANATLYLSKEDAVKYGLIEVKNGVTQNTAKPGTNVKVGTKDSWITSFELTDN